MPAAVVVERRVWLARPAVVVVVERWARYPAGLARMPLAEVAGMDTVDLGALAGAGSPQCRRSSRLVAAVAAELLH